MEKLKYKNLKIINKIHRVKPLETLLGKSHVYKTTKMSGAFGKPLFKENIILLKIKEENNRYKDVYNGGDLICSFLINDIIVEYISNMGNNLISYSIAIGRENIYFLTLHFKFLSEDEIDYDDLLETNDISV